MRYGSLIIALFLLVACSVEEGTPIQQQVEEAKHNQLLNKPVQQQAEAEQVEVLEEILPEQVTLPEKNERDSLPIGWDSFFDGEDVTKPSELFKALRGERVEITGWMGEVLSLGQGWFLLIPAPGADCPFCSEDGQFWNKIMIVFVEDASTLRYTREHLRVTGTLDVGIKVDESNYKTMFRLYDATFESIP